MYKKQQRQRFCMTILYYWQNDYNQRFTDRLFDEPVISEISVTLHVL